MNLLYNETVERIDRYTYKINQGGEPNHRWSEPTTAAVTVIFKNGIYHETEWINIDTRYSRSVWHVFGAVASRITELEAVYRTSGGVLRHPAA